MSRDALIVGINTYQYLPELRAPAQDAEAIAQQLHTCGEFRVHRLPEVIQVGQPQIGQTSRVTLRELETALVNLFKPKGSNIPQTALFYFSGHGIQKDAGIQEGYLAVSDSQPDVGFYGLSLFWLRRLLQESPVRQRIIWLDCCHSGELLNFLEADPGAKAGTDRLFMAASRDYESAYESLDSPYSVFTQALLKGLDPHREESGIITSHSLTAWVSHSLSGEIQQPLFDNSGSEIILTRGMSTLPQATPLLSSDICPYRGLEFFDEAHAEYFFGREELTDQLIKKLRTGQVVTVVGASGSGKSSLVRAGLIWELRRGRKLSGSDRWRIKLLTPTEHPLKSLAAAFIDPDLTDLERAEQLRRAEAFLQDGGLGLAQLVRASLPQDPGATVLQTKSRPRFLLVIDQFEEVFTLCRGVQEERERQQFFNCLINALAIAEECLSIVLVLRADFFGKCSLYENLAQTIEQSLVMVTPLNYEQIKATIIRPAQKVGLVCEPNLVYTMLLDVIGAPGELPLLQYTLMELWQRREHDSEGRFPRLTLDTYTELGGVRGTLQKRATEIFYSLTAEEQAVSKRIFLTLTQLGEGTEDTRRRVLKSELVSPAFPMELVECALEKLVAAKLVVTSQNEGNSSVEPFADPSDTPQTSNLKPQNAPSLPSHSGLCQETIDVAHEALIRNWSLLRNWLDDSREMLQRQRRIERAAQEWDAAGQPTGAEYLLRGGRLIDAEDFVTTYPKELSTLAQQYVATSQEESRRARRELRLLQIAVPSVLLVALVTTFNQYRSALQTQVEKNDQLQVATSRERAAIAQSILQEPDHDPTTALLISRLAAQDGSTYEAQSSLRAALRNLRLQQELHGHQNGIHQLRFSPNQHYIASAGADGTIRLWSLQSQAIYATPVAPMQILAWNGDTSAGSTVAADITANITANITTVAISPNGEWVAATVQGARQVKVWSTLSGNLVRTLDVPQPVNQILFSPDGAWMIAGGIHQSVAIWRADTGQLQTTLTHPGAIATIQFSPNGQLLLIAGQGGTVQLRRIGAASGSSWQPDIVTSLPHPGTLSSAEFSASGRWIATVSMDSTVRIWDTATGTLHQTLSPNPLGATQARSSSRARVVFSPNEQFLAVADQNQPVRLWQMQSGQRWTALETELPDSQDTELPDNQVEITPIAFSPDSQLLVTASRDSANADGAYTVYLWNTKDKREIGTLQGHQGQVEAIEFSLDGAYVATAGADGVVRLWAADLGGELPTVYIPGALVQWASFIPDQNQRTAQQVTRNSRVPQSTRAGIATPQDPTPSLPVAIADMMIVPTNGNPKLWQLWSQSLPSIASVPADSLRNGSPSTYTGRIESQNFWQWLVNLMKHTSRNFKFDPAPNSASSTDSHTSSPARKEEAIAPANKPLTGFAVSRDGQFTAAATADGWVEIRQKQANQTYQVLHRFQNGIIKQETSGAGSQGSEVVQKLAFSSDNQWLLGVSDEKTISLWEVRSGQHVRRLTGHQATVQDAQFSPDSQWIVTASWDNTARLWRVDSGQQTQSFSHSAGVSSASFSPDGQRVVTTSWDGTGRIFEVESGQMKMMLTGHRGAVLSAQFSPDGQLLVTAGVDGSVRLWDAALGEEQAQLRPTQSEEEPVLIRRAFFSPDGHYVAALTEAGQIHFWAATWEALLELARDRTLRQLTSEECSRYLRLTADQCPMLNLGS